MYLIKMKELHFFTISQVLVELWPFLELEIFFFKLGRDEGLLFRVTEVVGVKGRGLG